MELPSGAPGGALGELSKCENIPLVPRADG